MTQTEIDKALEAALITAAVVAAILAVSERHVYNLARAGKIKAVNIGVGKRPEFRFRSESVRRLLEQP